MDGVAALLLNLVITLAIAGGGGSSSGSSGGGGGFSGGSSSFSDNDSTSIGGDAVSTLPLPVGLALTAIIFGLFIFFLFAARKSARKRAATVVSPVVEESLLNAALNDPTLAPELLVEKAKEIFLRYQEDWSSFNLASMQTYMTPAFFQHNTLMMGALAVAARKNDVQNPVIQHAEVVTFTDVAGTSGDEYLVRLNVQVRDVLSDTTDGSQLFAQDLSTEETYRFQRINEQWLFAGIDQLTARPDLRNIPLEEFAKQNQFYYSLDWGHLLLPRHGQLFNSASFGVSDINNHVIGMSGQLLVQIYNYVANPNDASPSYLIAQATIPKSYGDIVVRRKDEQGSVRELRKMETEWGDFNTRYDVYASDQELATSFELLNPTFMEQLYAVPLPVSIEVVDTVIYLYAPQNGVVSADDYKTLLDILKAVFKEMRM